MANGRTTYRNTRTDAIRQSTKRLGYPYVEVDETTEKTETSESKSKKKTETSE
jgi:hypothetical protein